MVFSINPNQRTEDLLNEMLGKFGGTKTGVVNILADRYLAQEKMIEQLQEELDEERRLRKSLLRNLEHKMNVVYEIENIRLHYEALPKLKPSDQEPNNILSEAENYLEIKRNQEIFRHLEKRVND
ncbi:hypothetical protein EQ856_11550 [Enterococcus hirae]|uniref:hypothetical protein n=1 Tax=Enterococcus hirae TaxID=1354 RepID=UPI000FF8A61A|nr:hypothetical protein [Enterococcus hirae]EMF0081179.1 hypothetical protein [Enterococcus hirae]EMF0167153.1 hypothetical protein [Enterococcus hirae]EMF0175121.1 hypothetical protein [Enterococcus hirae]EMF0190674.1 hypothetical protein [Enterococcus hirae]EMF0195426.1 hypothetical protein [Enterococcus hirae]